MKKLIALLMSLVLVLPLVACSGGNATYSGDLPDLTATAQPPASAGDLGQATEQTPSSGETAKSEDTPQTGPVELRVSNYFDISSPNAKEEIAFIWDAFSQEHPDIVIIREDEFGDSYYNKIRTDAETGALADVVYCAPSQLGEWYTNMFKDLAPLVQRDGLDKDFRASALDPANQASSYLTVLPSTAAITATHAFFVNREVLDAVGLAPAKTYSELKEQVEPLAAAGYQTVMIANGDFWVMTPCLFSMVAGRFMGEDWAYRILNGEASFTDPEFVAALEFIKDMYDSGVIDLVQTLYLGYGYAPDQFAANTAAYYVDGDWRVGDIMSLLDPARQENFDIMVFPDIDSPWNVAFNRSTSGAFSGVAGWGINAALADGSPELEAAWTLIKWLTSKEVSEYLLSSGAIAKSVRNDIDYSSLGFDAMQTKYANLESYYDKATDNIETAFSGDVYNPLYDYLTDLGHGTMTPEEVAEAMQSTLNN